MVGRRYRCTGCGAVHLVVPRGVLPWLRYSAGAIALALALWALESQPASKVRQKVSPFSIVGPVAALSWNSLRRWARRPPWPLDPSGSTLRERARLIARTVLATSPLSAQVHGLEVRVFVAGEHFR